MKTKIIFLFTALFCSLTFAQEYKTLTSDAKLRKGRNLLSGVITTISEGTKVEIVYKSHEKGHYRVLYKNLNGYVHERHFEIAPIPASDRNLVQGSVIFREDFNNNMRDWRETQTASKSYYFRNGAYFIEQRENGRLTWESKKIDLDQQSDFSIEAAVTLHEKRNGGAHILFGMNEEDRTYYSIKIKKEKGKKEVFIGKYLNGQWIGAWSDGFINDFGKSNLIQISKKGNEISFYVNGVFAETRKFESFFGNSIGLGCEGVQKSSFDYLSIQQGSLNINTESNVPVVKKEVVKYNSEVTVRLRSYNGVHTIPATLNGAMEVYSIYEEGASGITLSPNVAHSLFKTGTIKENDWLNSASFEFPDGTIVRKNFKLKSLDIGGKTVYNVTCSISEYMEVAMIIGKNTLNKYGKFKMDTSSGVLTLGGN